MKVLGWTQNNYTKFQMKFKKPYLFFNCLSFQRTRASQKGECPSAAGGEEGKLANKTSKHLFIIEQKKHLSSFLKVDCLQLPFDV